MDIDIHDYDAVKAFEIVLGNNKVLTGFACELEQCDGSVEMHLEGVELNSSPVTVVFLDEADLCDLLKLSDLESSAVYRHRESSGSKFLTHLKED